MSEDKEGFAAVALEPKGHYGEARYHVFLDRESYVEYFKGGRITDRGITFITTIVTIHRSGQEPEVIE